MYPIPANATRIRYLESTGTQYIDTGIDLANGDAFALEVVGRFTSLVSRYQLMGIYASSYFGVNPNNRWIVAGGDGFDTADADTTRHTFLLRSTIGGTQTSYLTIDGGTAFSRSRTNNAGRMYLLNIPASGQTWTCLFAIESARLTIGSTLVRSFVPVRVGTVGYLFDRVTGQLFGNAADNNAGFPAECLGPDTFSQGVIPTRMMAMGVRKKRIPLPIGSVAFSGSFRSNLYHEFSGPPPTTYTWSGWIKTSNSTAKGAFVKVGKAQEGGGDDRGSGLAFGFGNTNFENNGSKIIALSESVAWNAGSSLSTLNSWHHYAVVVNGLNFIVYRDGSSVFSSSVSSILDYAPYSVFMGGYTGTAQVVYRFLSCSMTRCAMWNRALSASEVASDYSDGNYAPSITNGLAHFWPMSSSDNYLTDTIGGATLSAGTGGVSISTASPFA